MTKYEHPLFDEYGSYRTEALRFAQPDQKVGVWLACLTGAAIALVVTSCWLLVAG